MNCKFVSLSGFGLVLISWVMFIYVEVDVLVVVGFIFGVDLLVSGVVMVVVD